MPVTPLAIVPLTDASGRVTYQAISGGRSATGQTAGEALDALTAKFPDLTPPPLLLLQSFQGDAFFSALQQHRLATLMAEWRRARDQDQSLSAPRREELETLVDAELDAAIARTQALSDDRPEA
jgi:hypothetical protein